MLMELRQEVKDFQNFQGNISDVLNLHMVTVVVSRFQTKLANFSTNSRSKFFTEIQAMKKIMLGV